MLEERDSGEGWSVLEQRDSGYQKKERVSGRVIELIRCVNHANHVYLLNYHLSVVAHETDTCHRPAGGGGGYECVCVL